jgi:hypothetical protein
VYTTGIVGESERFIMQYTARTDDGRVILMVDVEHGPEKIVEPEEAVGDTVEQSFQALPHLVFALAAMLQRADTRDKVAVLGAALTFMLNDTLPKTLRFFECLENGTATAEELIAELLEDHAAQNKPLDSGNPLIDAFNDIDLNI